MERAQLYISRHRVGTDGDGIRTLVSFTGCNLDCKWCINRELRMETPDGKWYTPAELYEELLKDRWYFKCTGGGVTFSGGEPLLHSEFIKEFCEMNLEGWDIAVETSLNVSGNMIEPLLPYVGLFIVDIKDTDPGIYAQYTGGSVNNVFANLDYLRDVAQDEYGTYVVIRVPHIPEYNTDDDVRRSIDVLFERYMDYFGIDEFEYVKDKADAPEPDGKSVCRTLKAVRRYLIRDNFLDIEQPVCRHKGNCPGTCPMCEAELEEINSRLPDLCNWYRASRDMQHRYGQKLTYKPGTHGPEIMLAGIPAPPEVLMGDVCLPPHFNIDEER